MSKKNFFYKFFLLMLLSLILFNITFSDVNGTETILKNKVKDKEKTAAKNRKFSGSYFEYYTEKDIREELKKAGVNGKSTEAFIIANNNVKKEDITIDELEKGFLKALKYDSKNYLALDAIGQLYYREIGDSESSHLKALYYSEQTVKVNPKFQKGYEHLIWVSRGIENKKTAENLRNIAEKLIRLFPESPVGYFALSEYYEYYRKDYDKALSLGEKAKELAYSGKEPKRYYYEVAWASDVYEMILIDENAPGEKVEDFGEYSYSNEDSIGNMLLCSQFYTHMKKGDDKATFDYFFKSYGKMKEYREFLEKRKVTQSGVKEIIAEVKKLNEKYKIAGNKKIYKENLKKFKELGLDIE